MRTAKRLWFLALTSPLLYLLICAAIDRWVFAQRETGGFWPLSEDVYSVVFRVLAVVAIVALPAVFVLRVRWAVAASDAPDAELTVFGSARARRFVCLFMICDTIAVLGLVLFLIQGKLDAMFFFGILALAGYAISYPGGATGMERR